MAFNCKVFASALALAAALGAAGCGSSDKQDQPKGDTSRVVSARVIDGYLVRATVWADLNGNGELDSFEPRAFTDNDGYVSYNPLTETDYCAADAGTALARHCLRLVGVAEDQSVLIRVRGGYDSATGLPFKGMLTLRTSDLEPGQPLVVTPLTSLLAEADAEAPSTRAGVDSILDLLRKAGIIADAADVGADPFGGQLQLFIVTQLLEAIDGATGVLTKTMGKGVPSFNPDVHSQLAFAEIMAFVTKLTDANFIASLKSQEAAEALLNGFVQRVVTLYPELSSVNTSALVAVLAKRISQLATISDLVRNLPLEQLSEQERNALARSFALALERVRNNPNDAEIDNLIAWLTNQIGEPALGDDVVELGGDDVDVSLLINASIDPNSNTLSAQATLPADVRSVFASVVNTSFGVSVNKSDERGAALVYVSGDAGAAAGMVTVCVRYQDDSGDFDTGSKDDPNGALLLGGNWSLLDSRTLVLTVNVVGGARPLMIKGIGANGGERTYRFDFGSDLTDWSGTAPTAFAPGDVPTNDQECRSVLIEKFGPVS